MTLTSYAASWVTENMGCRQNRTTNTMPYPPQIDSKTELEVKVFYMKGQVYATGACLGDNAALAFSSLPGIQLAALLMTLVRKGASRRVPQSPPTSHLFWGKEFMVRGNHGNRLDPSLYGPVFKTVRIVDARCNSCDHGNR